MRVSTFTNIQHLIINEMDNLKLGLLPNKFLNEM